MTSSSPSSKSKNHQKIDRPQSPNRSSMDAPGPVIAGLRQSIIAKRQARGEKQLNIEYMEPKQMELSPAEVEKKERRREQNRRAAQRCRNKKRMNQKSVIQNYEKVVAKNELLQQELDAAKRELNGLRNTFNDHSTCCLSLGKVKSELEDVIKVETSTDEVLLDSIAHSSLRKLKVLASQEKATSDSQFFPNISSTDVFHYDPAESPEEDLILPSEEFVSSFNERHVDLIHPDDDFLQHFEQQQTSDDVNLQQHMWQYSHSSFPVTNYSSTSCMFSESLMEPRENQHQGQQKYLSQKKQEQTRQSHFTESLNETNCFQRNQSLVATQSSSIPSASLVSTHIHLYQNQQPLLPSESTPSQVVPSLRSPRPFCATSRTNFSRDLPRHRSLSGGSTSTSETSRSCTEENRFSSVSSEGSLYTDHQGSMLQDLRTVEVHDIDTDDVFVGTSGGDGAPLDGHDVNNNLETLPDNNRVIDSEVLQMLIAASDFLYMTPDVALTARNSEAVRARDTDNVTMGEPDDAPPFMQISSEELQLLSALGSSDHPNDILSNFLADTQRIDY